MANPMDMGLVADPLRFLSQGQTPPTQAQAAAPPGAQKNAMTPNAMPPVAQRQLAALDQQSQQAMQRMPQAPGGMGGAGPIGAPGPSVLERYGNG